VAQEGEKQVGQVSVAIKRYNPQTGLYGPSEQQLVKNLLTTAGRTFLLNQGYGTSLGTNGGNYIALSSNSDGASISDTVIADEITTNGLERAQGTITQPTNTDTSFIAKTFTATDTHTDVQLVGLLTAASIGTLVREAEITAVTLSANDELLVTWQISLS